MPKLGFPSSKINVFYFTWAICVHSEYTINGFKLRVILFIEFCASRPLGVDCESMEKIISAPRLYKRVSTGLTFSSKTAETEPFKA